jgi:hypothetical protein
VKPGDSVNVFVAAVAAGDDMTQQLEAVSAEPDQSPADNKGSVNAFVTVSRPT